MTTMAEQIAQDLLKIKAVTLSPQAPFTWASGLKAPIYTDNRQTIAFPEVRNHIANGLAQLIQQFYPQATVIAGVATAGIPHAALVADRLNLPLSYVRPKPKDHGAGKQVEGQLKEDDQVVLIDDLISTGGSVLNAAKAIPKKAHILGVAAIFSYDLPDSQANFQQAQVPLKTLTDYPTLIATAQQQNQITQQELELLQKWHQDPHNWH
ncbi:orotate phosphoribosyltransferase [Bombilactobacillus bombi]|uniref:orotate phosphoribosyltransferase n=1 Tax=Bombilactobacillus bombi TaxID=1303590 RepID=UPI0015E5D438|nr:orotate phosphoribosyltransferase [Bombilactobacillus bombi]MBA1392391.1 orotate phosphoribosyltransferase [Lactobacillus sp. XV13L]MBA1433702.1 orotate phosphoribosyltransferase [Bombilactobacillus bombi]